MDECTLAAAKRFEVDKFISWLTLCTTGYPLAIMVTRLQNKSTGGVCLTYSGFLLLLTLFFAGFLYHAIVFD